VDYSGKKVPIVDSKTGEIREAELFVGVLGASSYTFAEATWTQTLPDWIGSHVRMFAFFGGVPRLVVPDNLKSGVNRASFDDPEINRSYGMMASHYGIGVLPARPRRPQDKAKVESAVRFAQSCILGRLRKQTSSIAWSTMPTASNPAARACESSVRYHPTLDPKTNPEPFKTTTQGSIDWPASNRNAGRNEIGMRGRLRFGFNGRLHWNTQLALHAADHHHRLTEIGLPMAGRMRHRHEHFPAALFPLAHVILDDRVAAGEPALVPEPIEHPLGGMALFARHLQILVKPMLDRRNEHVQLRSPDR
jgi:hypothetical protein